MPEFAANVAVNFYLREAGNRLFGCVWPCLALPFDERRVELPKLPAGLLDLVWPKFCLSCYFGSGNFDVTDGLTSFVTDFVAIVVFCSLIVF